MTEPAAQPEQRPGAGGTSDDRQRRLLTIVTGSLIRPSFERCCEHGHVFFDTFYAGLADRVPGVGAMFADVDMHRQNELLREGIEALIAHAEGSDPAREELERLGKVHGREWLGIKPDLYPAWADALMAAIAEYDSQHSPLLEQAWREVLADGIELMTSFY